MITNKTIIYQKNRYLLNINIYVPKILFSILFTKEFVTNNSKISNILLTEYLFNIKESLIL